MICIIQCYKNALFKVIRIILLYEIVCRHFSFLSLDLFHNPPTETKISALPPSQDVFHRTHQCMELVIALLIRSVEADELGSNAVSWRSRAYEGCWRT